MRIAVVVPTIRVDTEYPQFLAAWDRLFKQHEVILVTVVDGDTHRLIVHDFREDTFEQYTPDQYFSPSTLDLIPHHCSGCCDLGFAWIAKYLPSVSTVLVLHDDVRPFMDTIQSHLDALRQRVPISWLASTLPIGNDRKPLYMQGFPYGVRDEAEVLLSHGIWFGMPDMDAPTQLLVGDDPPPLMFYRGPVPKGIYFPFSGMNIAFKRRLLPYMYYAPTGNFPGVERFDDTWLGLHLTRQLASMEAALVTGHAAVTHLHISNVYQNLHKEVVGIGLHEGYWQGVTEHPWFKEYEAKYESWQKELSEWTK